jgi:hypothetical protein
MQIQNDTTRRIEEQIDMLMYVAQELAKNGRVADKLDHRLRKLKKDLATLRRR